MREAGDGSGEDGKAEDGETDGRPGCGEFIGQARDPPPVGLGEANIATGKAALQESGLGEARLVVQEQLA